MSKTRSTSLRFLSLAGLGLGAAMALSFVGCKSNSAQAPIVAGTSAGDPADGNLAPVDGSTTSQPTQVLGQSASYAPQQSSESYPDGQQAPAPIVQGQAGGDYAYNQPEPTSDDSDAGVATYADQAPPPLPDYEQPPAPEDDYIWTPGYWAWGTGGYYWVPGLWTPPPYYGALWTPPYWGYYGGRYGFHHGYWGLHIGFYGGVDYGFGYIGTGYFGGYWHGHDFYYNRSVTRVGGGVHNVYNREVIYNNVHYGPNIQNRVSYNGGRGGINVAPRPAEVAAMHESHVGPIAAQTQVHQAAAQNRENFYSANHGKPAQAAFARPAGVPAGAPHIAEAPHAVQVEQQHSVAVQQHNVQVQQQRVATPPNPAEQRGAPGMQQRTMPNQPERVAPQQAAPQQRAVPEQRAAPEQQRPAAAPEQQRNFQQNRPAELPNRNVAPSPTSVAPRQAPEVRETPAARPAPAAAPVQRAEPAARPQPAPQQHVEAPRPAPAPVQHAAPPPAPRPAPAARPAPAPAAHPAPAPHAEPPHEEHH